MQKGVTVSAVVPAYNEEKAVGKIVDTLLACSLNQVVCINDGSTDQTEQILENFGRQITLVNHERNLGKGFALASGIKAAQGHVVMFVDADLQNLKKKHISQLLDTFLTKKYEVVIGVRSFEKANYYLPLKLNISGERVYWRDSLLPYLTQMRKMNFGGVEVFLNSLFKKNQVRRIILEGLYNPPKHQKRGFEAGIKEYLQEGVEIALELSKLERAPLEDYLRIKKIMKLRNIKDIRSQINSITNKYVKSSLKLYFKKYMEGIQKILTKI